MEQAEVNQPVQKSGSNKTIFIVLAIAIFLFLCFCCSISMAIALLGATPSTVQEREDFPVFEEEEFDLEIEEDKGTEYLDIDEISNIDGLRLSITNYDTEFMPDDEYYFAAPDKKYVAVEVYLVNNSGEPIYYTDFDFKIKDSDNYSYSNIFSGAKQPTLASGTLPAGQMLRGWITFEVPLEDSDLSLVYSGAYGDRSVEFSLR